MASSSRRESFSSSRTRRSESEIVYCEEECVWVCDAGCDDKRREECVWVCDAGCDDKRRECVSLSERIGLEMRVLSIRGDVDVEECVSVLRRESEK